MAQQVISGTDGNVTFPSGAGCKVTSWSATISQTVNSTTGYADDVWGTAIGMNNLQIRGSAGGFLSKGTSNDKPGITTVMNSTGGSFTLTADTGCTLSFVGITSDIAISHDRNNVATISYSFESTGVVTETWVTT